jgi:hypothetical protein
MTDYGTPENADLITEAIASAMLNVNKCQPGIVDSYDDISKTCSVAPAIRRPVPVEDGTIVTEELPIIQNVPVLILGAPSLSIEVELVKGDTVLLIFLDLSPAVWRSTGAVSDPPDLRMHGVGYPVAIPWHRPRGRASSDEKSTIGKAGGVRVHFKASTVEVGSGSDFVAMAQKVDGRLTALETFASEQATFDSTHTHPVAGVTPGPGAVTSAPAASPPPTPPSGTSTASANLKAD